MAFVLFPVWPNGALGGREPVRTGGAQGRGHGTEP